MADGDFGNVTEADGDLGNVTETYGRWLMET